MNKNAISKIILLAKKVSGSLNEEETVILGDDSGENSLQKIESLLLGAAVLMLVREKGSDVMPLYVTLLTLSPQFFYFYLFVCFGFFFCNAYFFLDMVIIFFPPL